MGALTIRTYGYLRDFLLKCVADQPRAVIVDLATLTITSDFLTSVFVTVWMRTTQWSTVPFVVVPGPANATRFKHSPTQKFLTVRPTVSDALQRLTEPPAVRRTVLWLPPSALSLYATRQFVAETCRNWQVHMLAADAAAVAAELVTNAIQHTASPATLRLELWRGRLTVAVTDDDSQPVHWPHDNAKSAPVDGGLQLVVHLARAWGCTPAWSGGKVTWAVLDVPARR
nr:ATP-binding protein [Kutzneria sp. CA-103260]